jgi:hypothetical protein
VESWSYDRVGPLRPRTFVVSLPTVYAQIRSILAKLLAKLQVNPQLKAAMLRRPRNHQPLRPRAPN